MSDTRTISIPSLALNYVDNRLESIGYGGELYIRERQLLKRKCHDIGDRGDFRCSACLVEWGGAENHDFLFCPSCGAEVER